MKFLVGNGKALQPHLQDFPWFKSFLLSKVLVVGIVEHDNTVAACGIRSMLNILTLHVSKDHRGRGLGKKILGKTIDEARKLGLRFILLGVSLDNPIAYNLYSTFDFEEIVHIKRYEVMMLPLSFEGELAYAFLKVACSLLPKSLLYGLAQWFRA